MMYCCSPQQPRGAHARHVQPLCLELHSIHCGGGLPQLDGPIDGPTLSLTPGRGIAQTAGKRAGASACQSLKPRGTLGIHALHWEPWAHRRLPTAPSFGVAGGDAVPVELRDGHGVSGWYGAL
eukprot:GHVT01090515.1.p2 GENE.GHVT01090515.1~~GHVT01090515.1.p2  ORF type:complete len:123 (-),score=19.43 GHVT01090515.1:1036-1404(-)